MSWLGDLFGDAGKEAADKNRDLSASYKSAGLGYLDSGLNSSKGYLDNAVGSFDSLANLGSKYGGATNMLMNALGVNGTAGNKAATDAFQAGPGYEFQLNQGLDAINRRRAAGGMLDSGNADTDAMTYATGLANQSYNGWLGNLGGFISPELSATQGAAAGRASGYGSLANLYQTDAANRIGLEGGYTSGMMGANNQEAQARSQGAKNIAGLGLSLASLGAGGLGGLGGLGGMGSLFSGGSSGGMGLGFGSTGASTGRFY